MTASTSSWGKWVDVAEGDIGGGWGMGDGRGEANTGREQFGVRGGMMYHYIILQACCTESGAEGGGNRQGRVARRGR